MGQAVPTCEAENCEPCRTKLVDPVRDVVRVDPSMFSLGNLPELDKAPAWPGWQALSTPWPPPADDPNDCKRLDEFRPRVRESPEQRQDREVLEWRRVEVDRQVQESARLLREAEHRKAESEARRQQDDAGQAATSAEMQAKQRHAMQEADAFHNEAAQQKELEDQEKLSFFLQRHGFDSVLAKRRKRFQAMYPLHAAVLEQDADMVTMLLRQRANPAHRNTRRETPLALALRCNKNGSHEEVMRALGGGE
mmetsp:Transcript_69480/g.166541  ORF Transcript_69480/g.166541 Transcript_69480/m.166541 type:complete len:251 (-) Transcript_69480:88-840(-)